MATDARAGIETGAAAGLTGLAMLATGGFVRIDAPPAPLWSLPLLLTGIVAAVAGSIVLMVALSRSLSTGNSPRR